MRASEAAWLAVTGKPLPPRSNAATDALAKALLEYVERHEAAGDPSGLPEYEQACAALKAAGVRP